MGVGAQHHSPAALRPGEIPCSPCTGCWVGLGAGLDESGNQPNPSGFEPLTFQPVASRYANCVTPAASYLLKSILILSSHLRLGLRGYLSSLDSLTDIFILFHPHTALFTPQF